ncbi:MAG: hypothetical protein AB1830_05805 [Pseudomonadota bacterium]
MSMTAMGTGYEDYEVVRVTSECRLVDAGGREHVYWRRDGQSLPAGWYVVSWPPAPGRQSRRFNEEAAFRGPFKLEADAHHALAQLRAGQPAAAQDVQATGAGARPQEPEGAPPRGGSSKRTVGSVEVRRR